MSVPTVLTSLFLIKWVGYGENANSWEPAKNLSESALEEARRRLLFPTDGGGSDKEEEDDGSGSSSNEPANNDPGGVEVE